MAVQTVWKMRRVTVRQAVLLLCLAWGLSSGVSAQSSVQAGSPSQAPSEIANTLRELRAIARGQFSLDLRDAFDAAFKGYRLAEEHHLPRDKSDFAAILAFQYSDLGNFPLANQYALEALNLAKQEGYMKGQIWAYYRLAGTAMELGKYGDALKMATEALRLSETMNNDTVLAWSYNMLGEVHRAAGSDSLAELNYRAAESHAEVISFKHALNVIRQNLGIMYLRSGNYPRAEALLIDAAKQYSNITAYFESELFLSELYSKTNRSQQSLRICEEMVKKTSEQGAIKWQKKFTELLAEIHLQNGHVRQAWQLQLKADTLREIISGNQVKIQLAAMDLKQENEEVKNENAHLASRHRTQQLIITLVVVIVVMLGFLGILLLLSIKNTKAMNAQLAAKNRVLDEVIAEKDMIMNIMVHDLKSPLNAISGLMALIEDPSTSAEDRLQFLELIRRSLDRGNNLVANLLELSRLESGDVAARSQEMDLRAMMEEVVTDFRHPAQEKAIRLEADLPANSVTVRSDRILLRRVVENIVGNALKFTPKGKMIWIRLQEGQEGWRVEVQDQGPGLTDQDRKKLFGKFQKLSAKPTAGEHSSGLGLAIVKALSEKIGVQILVDSTVGEGTTFTVVVSAQAA
ncbi:MAG: ATP-binding protein [Bacteroidia bacterium]